MEHSCGPQLAEGTWFQVRLQAPSLLDTYDMGLELELSSRISESTSRQRW